MEDKATSGRPPDGSELISHNALRPDADDTKAGRIPAEQLQAAARVAEARLRRLNGGRTSTA